MKTTDFIDILAPYAVADQFRSGVLASITIAQGALESGWGRSAPGNNLFGIKGTGQERETREYVNGEWITIQDGFRVYESWEGSVRDHSDFLIANGRYTRAGFFKYCKEMDYRGAAQALQSAGYATDPNYATKLINIIETYELTVYDEEAKNRMNELFQRITELENEMAALLKAVSPLQITAAPDWFVQEFGDHALDGLVNDTTGTNDFWRNLAVILRLFKLKKL